MSQAYIMYMPVYQSLSHKKVDLFDPICDSILGKGRGNAEGPYDQVRPTEKEIEGALQAGPLPIRGAIPGKVDAILLDSAEFGFNAAHAFVLKKAGYTRVELYFLPGQAMYLVVDAETGKRLMLAMAMRLRDI